MNASTHLLGGTTAGMSYVTVNTLFNKTDAISIVFDVVIVATAFVAGDLPDIDKPNTWISNRLSLFGWIAQRFTKHRAGLHTPLALLIGTGILSLLAFLLPFLILRTIFTAITIGFILGYVAHLVLDMVTPAGIMIWYPMSYKFISIASFNGNRDKFKFNVVLGSVLFVEMIITMANVAV